MEFIATQTEAEALLAEQNFIKQYRPRSTSGCGTTSPTPTSPSRLDEDYPRVYFTRERHRRGRAYFGPFSSAKRTRETLELLGKVFQYRTCEGAEPGRASGSPCLDYFIDRCQAPCVGYMSKEEYRANIDEHRRLPLRPLPPDRADLERGMQQAAERQEFEQAAISATASRRCARCSSASGSPTRGSGRSTR